MKKKIFGLALFTFFLDQILKQIIILKIPYQQIISIIPNFFYLTYVKNTGGAWSILSENRLLLLLIGIVSIGLLCYYLLKKVDFSFLEAISLGILLGGILGNFLDRLVYQGVIDYIGFVFIKYHFPIFNLADIGIVCGVILLMIDSLRSEYNGTRGKKR